MIEQELIEQVRSRIDLVELVGQYVPLRRAGGNYIARCPFHDEKTPSFNVSPDKGFYFCFGCKAAGDGFKFYQEKEGVSFPEALRALAERAGVELPETRAPEQIAEDRRQRELSDRLHAICEAAATFFERSLVDSPFSELARGALEERGVTAEIARQFRLGYAPAQWDALAQFIAHIKLSPADAELAGLLVPGKQRDYYDRFRHRLMFPVLDRAGRVVAFSGRILPVSEEIPEGIVPTETGKYMNSPETPLYKKSELLFGLANARTSIRQRAEAILVEGNFDVVQMHQHGFTETVAPLGTSFTEKQATLLRRFADSVVLVFDGDEAGRKAARASHAICAKVGLVARVGVLPAKMDPDSFLRSTDAQHGREAMADRIKHGLGIVEWLIRDTARNCGNSIPHRVAALRAIAPNISATTDAIERCSYERIASEVLQFTADEVRKAIDDSSSLPPTCATPDDRATNSVHAESPPIANAACTKEKPRIRLGFDEFRVTDEAQSALSNNVHIFKRAGMLVHVLQDDSVVAGTIRTPSAPRIVPLPMAQLRDIMSGIADWVRVRTAPSGTQFEEPTSVPSSAVQALHTRGEWPAVRPLDGIVECPILRSDGTILDTPGYDSSTGLLFIPNCEFHKVPTVPSADDARRAVNEIFDVVRDFPFKNTAHRSAWLAALLTPMARFAFHGPTPLNMISGNIRGVGKGLLVDVIAEIVSGRPFAKMAPTEDDSEQRKRITSLVLEGDSTVLIDNVSGSLGGPSLDAVLTCTEWRDRLLGSSTMISLPMQIIWYCTGNNIQLTGDLGRRTLQIRLESSVAHPEDRDGFQHTDLLRVIRQQRGRLVCAALTFLRAYCVVGQPDQKLRNWGSFDGWSRLIRHSLVWVGEPDPKLTVEELRDESDVAERAIRCLVTGWAEITAQWSGKATVLQVIAELERNDAAVRSWGPESLRFEALREALAELCSSQPGRYPSGRHVGSMLRQVKDRPVNCADGKVRAITVAKEHTKAGALWVVRCIPPEQSDSGDCGASSGGSPEGNVTAYPPRPSEARGQSESPESPQSPSGLLQPEFDTEEGVA